MNSLAAFGGAPVHGRADTPATPALGGASADARHRFLSEADCRDLLARIVRATRGGGHTSICVHSAWRGNVRWGRNRIVSASDVGDNIVVLGRNINGADGLVELNDTTDAAIVAATRRAERLARTLDRERPNADLIPRLPLEPASHPDIFSEATYQLDAGTRAATAVALIHRARASAYLSAGCIEVGAVGMGVLDTFGRVRYTRYTQARCSVTMRDPSGTASGWAGKDEHDWAQIDAPRLFQTALEKCVQSRNPVAVEPGRYTTILEPQAVCDFVAPMMVALGALMNEVPISGAPGPFNKSLTSPGYAKYGERVVDERITISADPMDSALGFPPFDPSLGTPFDPFLFRVFHPVTWIEHGVLKNLSYDRFNDYGGFPGRDKDLGQPNSKAFRMSGGTTAIDEMVATTKRGLLVTRFDGIDRLDLRSLLYRGYTRDGLWLIENGKITKAVRNLVFTESILFALNNVEQLGVPQRVFHPSMSLLQDFPQPVVVPPLKIKDFSFTALTDAV